MHIKIKHIFPFLNWIGDWKDPRTIRDDLIAGLTVSLILIPQAMAYAQLAGLPAYFGLYAAFITPIIAVLFGSSFQLGTGPVAMASLITGATLLPLAAVGGADYISYAILLALMVGVIRLFMGFFKLGFLVNFLSFPVILGFTNAAALIIASSQLSKIFNVQVEVADFHLQTVWRVVVATIDHLHWPSLGMSVFALSIMISLKKFYPKLPFVLFASIITTLVAYFCNYTGRVVGDIPAGLPYFKVPTFNLEILPKLLIGALTIALLGLMEAMALAKNITVKTKQKLNINQELIGQGMANLFGSFFGSLPISSSFSRSALIFNSSAKSGFSTIVTSLSVMLILLFFTPILHYLPQATLAAIIMMAVLSLIRIKPLLTTWKIKPPECIISLITFVVTLAFAPALHIGILTGVFLSLVFYFYKTMYPSVASLARHADGTLRNALVHELNQCQHISIIRFEESLFFGNCSFFEKYLLDLTSSKKDLKCIIIDNSAVNDIDSSGESMLRELVIRMSASKILVLFSHNKFQVLEILTKSGFVTKTGQEKFFRTNQNALDFAWRTIECDHVNDCPLNAI